MFLLPAVSPEDLLEWTASADVLVVAIQPTSLNHQFTTPQKLFEALAAGVPVVAADLPGIAEVVATGRPGTGFRLDGVKDRVEAGAESAMLLVVADCEGSVRQFLVPTDAPACASKRRGRSTL